MLVRGERRGGGLLWVLLVQLPSLAHGCRLMEGLEVLSSWEQVSQRLWTTWGNIDYLFLMSDSVSVILSLFDSQDDLYCSCRWRGGKPL